MHQHLIERTLLYCAVKKADEEDKAKLLDKVDAFIFDCDGKIDSQCVPEAVWHQTFSTSRRLRVINAQGVWGQEAEC